MKVTKWHYFEKESSAEGKKEQLVERKFRATRVWMIVLVFLMSMTALSFKVLVSSFRLDRMMV